MLNLTEIDILTICLNENLIGYDY